MRRRAKRVVRVQSVASSQSVNHDTACNLIAGHWMWLHERTRKKNLGRCYWRTRFD